MNPGWAPLVGRIAFRVRTRWAAKQIETALHVLVRHHKGENVLSLRLAESCAGAAEAAIATLQREMDEEAAGGVQGIQARPDHRA